MPNQLGWFGRLYKHVDRVIFHLSWSKIFDSSNIFFFSCFVISDFKSSLNSQTMNEEFSIVNCQHNYECNLISCVKFLRNWISVFNISQQLQLTSKCKSTEDITRGLVLFLDYRAIEEKYILTLCPGGFLICFQPTHWKTP